MSIYSNCTDTTVSTGSNCTDTTVSTGSNFTNVIVGTGSNCTNVIVGTGSHSSDSHSLGLSINIECVDSSENVNHIMNSTENSSDKSHKRQDWLATFLSSTDSINTTYATYIAESREHKKAMYIKHRADELLPILSHPLIIASREDIYAWYDLFQMYSIMGYINKYQYWTCMKALDYPFASWRTRIHTIFFQMLSTSMHTKMNVTEFVISTIILTDQAPNLLDKSVVFNDIIKYITPDMLYDFPVDTLYNISVLNEIYNITRDTLCKILESSKDNPNMKILFYSLFAWIPKND
jgi:hypothetical protein